MATRVLIRDLDEQVVEQLKQRASTHGRSLQAELKDILMRAAEISRAGTRQRADAWRQRLKSRGFRDSTSMIRQDRRR